MALAQVTERLRSWSSPESALNLRFWTAAPDWLWRAAIFAIALAILVVITTRWNVWSSDASRQTTDDAYLQADLTPILAKVSGYIRTMPVEDYERVQEGQLLAELVDDDYRAAVAQLESSVLAAGAQIQTFEAQQYLQDATIRAARAAVNAASVNLDQNGRDTARQVKLLESKFSSPDIVEKLRTTGGQLTAELAQLVAQAEAAERQQKVLDAQVAQARANYAEQKASLDIARINLSYTRIVAPQSGVLGQRQIKPGQFVGVGGQLTSLTPLPIVWVIANFKETQLTHMYVGNGADIEVDTFPGHVLHGHVLALAPGAGSQFALLPPDNATGNFTKVVQRVAVKISIDDADGLIDRLRPGMSVIATVDTSTRP
jgi:membrane fusion protein (multidrug efflux system)